MGYGTLTTDLYSCHLYSVTLTKDRFSDNKEKKIRWNQKTSNNSISLPGQIRTEVSVHISDLLFCVDLETPAVGSPLNKEDKTFISKIECSPVLGGFAIVLSDGRGGFLSSSSADSKPEEIVGVFAKDLNNAVNLAVNIKYQV